MPSSVEGAAGVGPWPRVRGLGWPKPIPPLCPVTWKGTTSIGRSGDFMIESIAVMGPGVERCGTTWCVAARIMVLDALRLRGLSAAVCCCCCCCRCCLLGDAIASQTTYQTSTLRYG